MADYPRIGEKNRASHPAGNCIFCGQPKADYRIAVEHSYMRGDDEIIKAHWNCVRGIGDSQLMQKILDYWRNYRIEESNVQTT